MTAFYLFGNMEFLGPAKFLMKTVNEECLGPPCPRQSLARHCRGNSQQFLVRHALHGLYPPPPLG
jgi:hypothetical protein